MKTPIECRFCSHPIPIDQVFEKSAVCSHCGSTFPLRRGMWDQFGYRICVSLISIMMLFASYFAYFARENRIAIFETLTNQQLVDLMTEKQALTFFQSCLTDNDIECRLMALTRLLQLNPSSESYLANMAFALTDNKNHKQAFPIYQNLLNSGYQTAN